MYVIESSRITHTFISTHCKHATRYYTFKIYTGQIYISLLYGEGITETDQRQDVEGLAIVDVTVCHEPHLTTVSNYFCLKRKTNRIDIKHLITHSVQFDKQRHYTTTLHNQHIRACRHRRCVWCTWALREVQFAISKRQGEKFLLWRDRQLEDVVDERVQCEHVLGQSELSKWEVSRCLDLTGANNKADVERHANKTSSDRGCRWRTGSEQTSLLEMPMLRQTSNQRQKCQWNDDRSGERYNWSEGLVIDTAIVDPNRGLTTNNWVRILHEQCVIVGRIEPRGLQRIKQTMRTWIPWTRDTLRFHDQFEQTMESMSTKSTVIIDWTIKDQHKVEDWSTKELNQCGDWSSDKETELDGNQLKQAIG
jgi:hypothetical protein